MKQYSRITIATVVLAVCFIPVILCAKSQNAEKTYLKYRSAIEKRDSIEEIFSFMPEEQASFLKSLPQEAMKGYSKMFFDRQNEVYDVKVMELTEKDKTTILTLEGKRASDDKPGKGKAILIMEEGAWKIDEESWDFDWDVVFSPSEDRTLAKNDGATGTFSANGEEVSIRYAYVDVVQDPFDREKQALSLMLSDNPIRRGDYGLMSRVEDGTLHYIKMTIDRSRRVTGAMLHHGKLNQKYISIAGNISFTATSFGPSTIAGRVRMTEPRVNPEPEDSYMFNVEFTATLWEISGKHLGSKPDGSFGIPAGKAAGTFTTNGKQMKFSHAYARLEKDSDGEELTSVLITDKPIPSEHLVGNQSLSYVMQNLKMNGLSVSIDRENEPSGWQWIHDGFSSGCYVCSDMIFAPAEVSDTAVKGTLYTPWPKKYQDTEYEFKTTFHARILKEGEQPDNASVSAEGSVNLLKDSSSLPGVFSSSIGNRMNVIELVIYEEYASLKIEDPSGSGGYSSYLYREGSLGEPQRLEPFTVPCKKSFSLDEADFSILPRLQEDALKQLGLSGGKIQYVILHRGVFCKKVQWTIYAGTGMSVGYVSYALNGKKIKVYKPPF